MATIKLIITYLLAYLLGSIPTAVWTGKIFHKTDIREYGSGNAGATNVVRVLGWKTGVPVLFFDVFKGWLAAMLPHFFNLANPGSASLINIGIISGLFAIAGHIFPVFADFRGGKGVATAAGALLAIDPLLTLACFGVFLLVMLISGYVSLSSMCAGVAFPIFLFLFFDTPSIFFKIFSIFMAGALVFMHRKNISRLLKGEESKLFRKGKKQKNQ